MTGEGVLLYLLSPRTAVNLVDFYFVRKVTYSITGLSNDRLWRK